MYITLVGTVMLTLIELPIDNYSTSKEESTVTVYNAADPVLMSKFFNPVLPPKTGFPFSHTCVKLEGNVIDVKFEFS
jgi:hypothetical protein